jgi:hypothetical protein
VNRLIDELIKKKGMRSFIESLREEERNLLAKAMRIQTLYLQGENTPHR